MNTYDDVGAGYPVVLIHGHPFNRTMWTPQVEFLRSRARVITPDLRGYGENRHHAGDTRLETFASDILTLLDELGVDRFLLGGLSMGGQIALELFRQQRPRVAGMILADTFAQVDSPQGKQLRYTTADRLLREGMEAYAVEVLPKMIARHHIDSMPAVAAHVLRMMQTTPPAGAAAALRGRAERIDYTPLLAEIDIPVLIVVGDQDEYTPVSDARFMSERIRGAELVVIEDAGHMPNLEQPAAFNASMGRFVDAVTDVATTVV